MQPYLHNNISNNRKSQCLLSTFCSQSFLGKYLFYSMTYSLYWVSSEKWSNSSAASQAWPTLGGHSRPLSTSSNFSPASLIGFSPHGQLIRSQGGNKGRPAQSCKAAFPSLSKEFKSLQFTEKGQLTRLCSIAHSTITITHHWQKVTECANSHIIWGKYWSLKDEINQVEKALL